MLSYIILSAVTFFHERFLVDFFFFHLTSELLVENTYNLVNTKHSKFILGLQTWVWG